MTSRLVRMFGRYLPKTLVAKMASSCTDYETLLNVDARDRLFVAQRSNLERARYALALPRTKEVVLNDSVQAKDDAQAASYLAEGDKKWKADQPIPALRKYSLALLHSSPDGEEYGKVLRARAQCLAAAGRLVEALRDLDLALAAREDKETMRQRKEVAGRIQRNEGKDTVSLPPALLRSAAAGKLAMWGDDRLMVPRPLPQLDGEPNAKIPAATDAVSLITTEDKGRALVAVRDIPAGKNILVEDPFLFVPEPSVRNISCANCTVIVDNPVPCQACSEVVFCSLHCREKGHSLHSQECGRLHLLDESCHRAVRLAILNGLSALVEPWKTLEFGDYQNSADPRHIDHLTSNAEKRNKDQLASQTSEALFCYKWLEGIGFFPEQLNPEDRVVSVATLLDYLQKSSVNVFMLSDKSDEGDNTDLGSTMYAAISFINHSCHANCDWYFVGNTEVIKTLRTIEAGELLSINYNSWCGLYHNTAVEDRRKHHRRDYFFTCDCAACTARWGESGAPAQRCPREEPGMALVKESIRTKVEVEHFFNDHMADTLSQIITRLQALNSSTNGVKARPYKETEECTQLLMRGMKLLSRFEPRTGQLPGKAAE